MKPHSNNGHFIGTSEQEAVPTAAPLSTREPVRTETEVEAFNETIMKQVFIVDVLRLLWTVCWM